MTDSITSPAEKQCKRCEETKPTTEFHNDKSRKDGKHPYCKACYYAYTQEKRNRKDFTPPSEKWCNKCQRTLLAEMFGIARARASGLFVHCKECTAQWRDDNRTTLRHRGRSASKQYRQQNRDVCLAKMRLYHVRNRDKRNEYHRDYKRIFKPWQYTYYHRREWVLAKQHVRRTRIKGNGGYFTERDIANMRYIQQGHCCYCGRVGLPFAIDHIIPVKHGGPSDPWNLALCCRDCNSQKNDRTLEQWTDRWYLP